MSNLENSDYRCDDCGRWFHGLTAFAGHACPAQDQGVISQAEEKEILKQIRNEGWTGKSAQNEAKRRVQNKRKRKSFWDWLFG